MCQSNIHMMEGPTLSKTSHCLRRRASSPQYTLVAICFTGKWSTHTWPSIWCIRTHDSSDQASVVWSWCSPTHCWHFIRATDTKTWISRLLLRGGSRISQCGPSPGRSACFLCSAFEPPQKLPCLRVLSETITRFLYATAAQTLQLLILTIPAALWATDNTSP